MFHVVLFEPEIPPNTGNIIRLCANTGSRLHLIHPLGFALDDTRLKRAGLDYHEYTAVREYENLDEFNQQVSPARVFAVSTRGTQSLYAVDYRRGDSFLFGPETRGLPQAMLSAMPAERVIRIPMLPQNRSLNLSNAVAIVIYEAWRQLGTEGAV